MVPEADEPAPKPFELGKEVVADGRFVRQASVFRRWVRADGSSGLPAAAGRYHLYVCLACPWSHRTVIVRHVKGLEEAVSMSLLDPFRDEGAGRSAAASSPIPSTASPT
jgi:putative glutathione S-transferase